MFKSRKIVYFSALIVYTLFASDKDCSGQNIRELYIITGADATEVLVKKPNALTKELRSLIENPQNQTPILVEFGLWKNMLRFVKKDIQQSPFSAYLFTDTHYPEDFSYLLLIPQQYKEQYWPSLGFNLKNFELIKDPWDYASIRHKAKLFLEALPQTLLLSSRGRLKDVLASLLLPADKELHWNIFLSGHGNQACLWTGATIAGLPTLEFKAVLDFLNTQISTNLFAYSTCYAGSLSLMSKIYEKNIYNFAIIATGLEVSTTFRYAKSHGIELQEGLVDLRRPFRCLSEAELGEAVKKIHQVFTPELNNTPHIRLPSSDHFTVLPIKGYRQSLSQTAEASPEIQLTARGVLIDKPFEDKKITLSFDRVNYISSSIANNIYHVLNHVELTEYDFLPRPLNNFLKLFVHALKSDEQPAKIYVIKLITLYNIDKKALEKQYSSVIVFINAPLPLKTFGPQKKVNALFYIEDGQAYLQYENKDPLKLDQKQQQEFEAFFAQHTIA